MSEEPVLEHAILGASGAKKWMACTMSVAVEREIPEEESEYAAEGTCAHAVGEVRLLNWLDQGSRDETLVDQYETYFSQEFSDHVDTYVNHSIDRITALREAYGEQNVIILVERRVRFDQWVPEGFGTADCIILYPGGAVVIDLKYGAGVFVDAYDNPQLKLYGLGAYAAFNLLYDIEEVTVEIVQPRMDNIAGETLKVKDLLVWAEEVVKPRAAIAWAAYNGDRSQARFAPGEHCSTGFCKARQNCSARARWMLESAEMPYAMNEPDTLTVDQLEKVAERAEMAVRWLRDCRRYLISRAAKGEVNLRKYELVEGRSWREITDESEAAKILMQNGYAAKDIYAEPRLRGIVALEKLVGKSAFGELLEEVINKPPGKPTLAPRGGGRSKVKPKAAGSEFDAFDEE